MDSSSAVVERDVLLNSSLLSLVLVHADARAGETLAWCVVSPAWLRALLSADAGAPFASLALHSRGGGLGAALDAVLAPRVAADHVARLAVVEAGDAAEDLVLRSWVREFPLRRGLPRLEILRLECPRLARFAHPPSADAAVAAAAAPPPPPHSNEPAPMAMALPPPSPTMAMADAGAAMMRTTAPSLPSLTALDLLGCEVIARAHTYTCTTHTHT